MPVPGTITPEPEPVEVESDAAFPSASTAETCVVPPAPAGEAILDARAPGAQLGGRQQARGETTAMERAREVDPAGARLLAHHLDERGDRLRAPRLAVVEA